MSSTPKLSAAFPWAKTPLICNAPMAGGATPALASEVSRVGGLGFLGCVINSSPGSSDLEDLQSKMEEAGRLLDYKPSSDTDFLPIGIGFLTCHPSIAHFAESALPIIKKYRPAAVWLFAPSESLKPHKDVIAALKTIDSPPKIFNQVGNVAAAREAVEHGSDVIVCQGIDAGGHQYRRGSGVVALVPEVRQMLEREFPDKSIHVVAAGGIADGRGVAAMLALGAEAVVMGTRFIVTPESAYANERKQLILASKDGGISTLKSSFNDEVTGSTIWGSLYDGRAIVGPIHEDFIAGKSLEECQKRVEAEVKAGNMPPQICTWASAAVGLIEKELGAAEIVEQVREEALKTIRQLAGLEA